MPWLLIGSRLKDVNSAAVAQSNYPIWHEIVYLARVIFCQIIGIQLDQSSICPYKLHCIKQVSRVLEWYDVDCVCVNAVSFLPSLVQSRY